MDSRGEPTGRHDLIIALLALGLFVPLFIFRGTGPLDFWNSLSLTVIFLSVFAVSVDSTYGPFLLEDLRTNPAKKIIAGLLSALVLYGIYFLGNLILRNLVPASGAEVSRVYGFGAGVSRWRVILFILLFIGPGEEIFWRGYLQRAWQARFSNQAGWLLTTLLYAGVHAGSGNPVLVLAAVVCGLFWGWLFLRYRSPLMLCVSHTFWDLLAFVIIPFQ